MKQKMRIQIGVEGYVGGIRTIRVTPIDKSEEIDISVGTILALVLGQFATKDFQPGDGELDIPINDVSLDILKKIPGAEALKEVLGGTKLNVFIRIK